MTFFSSRRLSRRALGRAAVGALLLGSQVLPIAAGDVRAAPPEPVTIRVGLFKGSALAAQLAQRNGDFERAGLRIEPVFLQAGPAILLATARRMVDIGYGDTFAWVAALENGFTGLKLIAPANGTDSWVIATPGSPIKNGDDIAGKRIGVTPTPYTASVVRHWVRLHHGDPDSVNFVTIPIGGQLAAMKTGSLDAVFAFDFVTKRQLEHAGGKTVAALKSVTPPGAAGANYYSTDAFIESHRDAVVAFVRVLRSSAARFAAADDRTKAAWQGPIAGLDYARLTQQIPGLLLNPEWGQLFDGPIDAAATQAYVDLGVQERGIAKPYAIAPNIYWTATASSAALSGQR
ncbi:ABC transporter substrate-binding protein [Chitinasiproducens palmae]|uniref:ABC-type nitrate/sulfonate/bicarbonate transport system, substrate-binding protein n=1 Tax=Chitinasiproducens palmae TaxID=1770053 RepID=A0A1H2PR00_9BURK|nr:ABC transporter substrate-binding protein [Chitinasiproducens palmae]SDV48865.1 ABC-type nitrate/sulfonate/bicarbonate transport system, substrate-binding protein [Chitinasiproducens palmae]